jgi:hypothetical protein
VINEVWRIKLRSTIKTPVAQYLGEETLSDLLVLRRWTRRASKNDSDHGTDAGLTQAAGPQAAALTVSGYGSGGLIRVFPTKHRLSLAA